MTKRKTRPSRARTGRLRATGSRPPRKATRAASTPRPNKRLGQHFLAPAWAEKVVTAIAPESGDIFLEIGPGTGALTLPLATHGVPVLAIEVDRRLVADLLQRVPPHVTVMTGDFLQADVRAFLSGLEPQRPPASGTAVSPPPRFRVAGNLPYGIASPILFKLIALHRQHGFFSDATVMLQREVVDRITARPGTRDYGVLTVMLAVHTRVERLLDLPPGAFRPPPKVRSAVIRLTFGPPSVKVRDEALFERMVKAVFSQRRKTLQNALKAFDPTGPAVLALAGIDGRRRPETLQVAELARLADLFASVREPAML